MSVAFWFQRDHRLQDNIALNAAVMSAQKDGLNTVYPFSVVDLDSFQKLSGIRQHSLTESLAALNESLNGCLSVAQVSNRDLIPRAIAALAKASGVSKVFATRGFDPQTVRLQKSVGVALADAGVQLFLFDSYYAVAPGSVQKPDGTPYRVYTPFFKNWELTGWQEPAQLPQVGTEWKVIAGSEHVERIGIPIPSKDSPIPVRAGEIFALETFERFKRRALNHYDEDRNRADLSGTSHLSHALAFGEIHPRTLLCQLGDSKAHIVFKKEIAWREFYADVLWHNPDSETDYLEKRFASMRYDSGDLAETRLRAWQEGRTGYPMVDAGMRQLLTTGWMHNRVRMIVASFLVKDLHLEWQQGASWFEQHLSDFDPASNSHGWQWTAGCGTDASPYYRVFNPVLQGLKFDPNGDYVRKFVPELANVSGPQVHEPWLIPGLVNVGDGYPERIVDHAVERDESLARLKEIKV